MFKIKILIIGGLLFPFYNWALTGRVLEKAMMSPVPGAKVFIDGGVDTVYSDSLGNFTIDFSSGIKYRNNQKHIIPFTRGNQLILDVKMSSRVNLEFFDSQGGIVYSTSLGNLSQGSHTISTPPLFKNSGTGIRFLSIQTNNSESFHKLVLLTRDGFEEMIINNSSASALAKRSSPMPGTVKVSKPKLLGKDVVYSTDNQNLGDIVLDYPPRVLGVGAQPPYGSVVLFSGLGTKAQAEAELATKWHKWAPNGQEWAQTTQVGTTFKIVPEWEALNDANRWTLQSCCHATWGYDDLVANEAHGDVQLHVEFVMLGEYDDDNNPNANENDSRAKRQPGYNNSGSYIQNRYEIQIESITYSTPITNTHHMAAIVDDKAPDVNADRPNGQYHAYDITFRTSRWNGNTKSADGIISAWWNKELIHDNVSSTAPATGLGNHSGEPINSTLFGLKLQSEGTDVRYRNIWMKHLNITGTDTKFGY